MSDLDKVTDAEEPNAAWCENDSLRVRLADGREIVTPRWWYPRLVAATHAQRNVVELSPFGVHWPEVDEDLSIKGMLRGAKAPGATPRKENAA